jgi:hypothetical protein
MPRPAMRGIPERQVHPQVRGEHQSKPALYFGKHRKETIWMDGIKEMRQEMGWNASGDVVGLSCENASGAKPGPATRHSGAPALLTTIGPSSDVRIISGSF